MESPEANSLDLKGRPKVYEAKTGTWKGAKFMAGLALADWQVTIGLAVNLVTLLLIDYGQTTVKASTITTNFIGTSFLLAVLGGFIADSYLGGYYTTILGGVVMSMGLAALTFVVTSPMLRPTPCAMPGTCNPAGNKYMAPLYIALYTVALGTGLLKPTLASLAGEQFDVSVPAEKKQVLNFFIWFYFLVNIGILIALTLGVYLHSSVSQGWGFGFSLMFFFAFFVFFLAGTPQIRRKRPAGSFLTRVTQVLLACIRKTWSTSVPDKNGLYDPNGVAIRGNKLRFLDRAATIDEEDRETLQGGRTPNPWRLCTVAQVEESKRLLQLLPLWACTTVVTLIFSQLSTFTIQQALTMNRNLGSWTIAPATLGTMTVLVTFILVPIYSFIVVPLAKIFTGSSYGLTPITRMGLSLIFAFLTMLTAGLVERKRVAYIHEGHLEIYPIGAYILPMSFWWLLPQYALTAGVEFFFYSAAYEFFFFETSAETRSIGTSFTLSSAALGFFMSTITVNIINFVTRRDVRGSWLTEPFPGQSPKGQLNVGGLSKYYFFLAAFIFVAFLLYLIAAYFYECNHDWYGGGSSSAPTEDGQQKPSPNGSPKADSSTGRTESVD